MVFNHFSCAVGSPYVFFGEISIQIKSIQVWNLWHFYCVVFLLLSCSISLYIVDIKPLSHIYLHIFSPICVLSFHFLDGVVFSTEFQFQPKKAAFLPLDKMSCSLWQFLTNWVLRDLHLQVHLFHQGFCLPKSAKVGVKSGPLGKIQGSRVHTGNLGWLILLRITSLEKKKKRITSLVGGFCTQAGLNFWKSSKNSRSYCFLRSVSTNFQESVLNENVTPSPELEIWCIYVFLFWFVLLALYLNHCLTLDHKDSHLYFLLRVLWF